MTHKEANDQQDVHHGHDGDANGHGLHDQGGRNPNDGGRDMNNQEDKDQDSY